MMKRITSLVYSIVFALSALSIYACEQQHTSTDAVNVNIKCYSVSDGCNISPHYELFVGNDSTKVGSTSSCYNTTDSTLTIDALTPGCTYMIKLHLDQPFANIREEFRGKKEVKTIGWSGNLHYESTGVTLNFTIPAAIEGNVYILPDTAVFAKP